MYAELATCHRSKCHHEIHRENTNCENHIINNILIDSLINCTWLSPNVFSNYLFHVRRHPSLSATHCLTHTHTLSLSPLLPCLAIFPILIVWYKNHGIHLQVIIDRNKLFEYTPLFHLEPAYNNWAKLNQFFISRRKIICELRFLLNVFVDITIVKQYLKNTTEHI